MAVDKLVDSTQLDADLTSVANAIRTKGGTSAQMAFPAGFVSAVEAIPTGGGSLPEVLDKIDAGTATIATATQNIYVTHNLGKVPDFACIYQDLDDWDDVVGGGCVMATYFRFRYADAPNETKDYYIQSWRYKHATSGNALGGNSTMSNESVTTTTFRFSRGTVEWPPVNANNDPVTYKWIVGTFKEAS